eukprot:5027951-Ditylum_brightwellii.AAC.1
MSADTEGTIPIPDLPPEATKTKIFKHMNSGALLSSGQLCDAKCEVYMNKKECNIYYEKQKFNHKYNLRQTVPIPSE